MVKNLFRSTYGGNRNYALMYTLGGLMVSADDDMRSLRSDGHKLRQQGAELAEYFCCCIGRDFANELGLACLPVQAFGLVR